MCTSLLRFLIPFNLAATLVAFAAANGQTGIAVVFSLAVWATTLTTAFTLNVLAQRVVGESAGCKSVSGSTAG